MCRTRSWRKVSTQVYEPETIPEIAPLDIDRFSDDESENTPIFHALVRRSPDPVEHFHRDPLRAPLPTVHSTPPAMTRMLLHSVPTGHAHSTPGRHAHPVSGGAGEQPGAGRHRWHGESGSTRAWQVSADLTQSQRMTPSQRSHRSQSARSAHEVPSRRGGRHRVLRAVTSVSS
jgi:hypothetical protein